MEKKVTCLFCKKQVRVKLISCGYSGHIGLCPVCKKLAYKGK